MKNTEEIPTYYINRCGPQKFNFREYIPSHWLKTIIEETQHIRGPLAFDPSVSLIVEFNGKTVVIPLDKFKKGDTLCLANE